MADVFELLPTVEAGVSPAYSVPKAEGARDGRLYSALAAWLPLLLQMQDSSFPTGGYAHSFGLEELAQLGLVRDEATLADYLLNSVVPALVHLELPFAAEAHRLAPALAHVGGTLPQLVELDATYAAFRASQESRAASAQIGGRRLATWLKVRPDPALERLHKEITAGRMAGHHAIVFPAILRAAPLEIMLGAYAHQTLAGLCTASLKLIRIGQEGTQRALAQSLAAVTPRIAQAAATPLPQAGWFDPLTEIASMRHETSFARLFIS